MKLKSGVVTEKAGDGFIAVATGEASKTFNGFIRNNKTADYIFRLLMTDKTEDELVFALLDKYDVSKEVATRDVQNIIKTIRKAGLLDD